MDEERKIRLQVITDEIARLGDSIAERQVAAERFIAIAGTAAAAGLTLGLVDKQGMILLFLPIAIAIILLYIIQIYTDAGMHSGHRKALEIRINQEFGQIVLVGQSHVAARHARRRSVQLTFIFMGLAWIGVAILGLLEIIKWSPELILYKVLSITLYLLIVVFLAAVLALASKENIQAESIAESAARSAWE